MNSIEKRLSRLNGTVERDYMDYVDRLIRRRYSVSAELAILRQKDTKPEEFAEYNAYAESCKAEAKAELGMEG
jgi:DNA repair ATPase RecN